MSKDNCVGCDKVLGLLGDVDEQYKTLVLGQSCEEHHQWLPFCKECGNTETLTNGETGEVITFIELYERKDEDKNEGGVL